MRGRAMRDWVPRRPLRLAVYNIHRAVGADRRRDPARIAGVIRELDADIIGLQEVDWQHDWDTTDSPLEMLSHLPGYQAVPGPNLRDRRGHYGNLLLTRLGLGEVRRIDLSEPGREPRGAIDADIEPGPGQGPELPGGRLRVIVTHLGLGPRERWRQATRLGQALDERPGAPAVLLGDLNEWIPGNPTLRPLLRHAGEVPRLASFPSFLPFLALDRVLPVAMPAPFVFRRHASALARRASDHLPIVMELGAAPAGS